MFKATVLARLNYACQFWWGFANSNERDRLEAFLRKATRCNFYDGLKSFEDIVLTADQKLFQSVLTNPLHVLHSLLPDQKSMRCNDLRPRNHNFVLPKKKTSLAEKNFLTRMLYLNSY